MRRACSLLPGVGSVGRSLAGITIKQAVTSSRPHAWSQISSVRAFSQENNGDKHRLDDLPQLPPSQPQRPSLFVNLHLKLVTWATRQAFDIDEFLTGAKYAYDLIQRKFWNGSTEGFDNLVSKELLKAFNETLVLYKEKGWTTEFWDQRIESCDIIKASIVGDQELGSAVMIDVQFVTSCRFAMIDETGRRVQGTDDFVPRVDTFRFRSGVQDLKWQIVLLY